MSTDTYVVTVTAVDVNTNTCSVSYDGDILDEVPYFGAGPPVVGALTLAFLSNEQMLVLGAQSVAPPAFAGLSRDSGGTWAVAADTSLFTVSAMSWNRIGPLVTAAITITRSGSDLMSTTTGDISNLTVATATAAIPKPLQQVGGTPTVTGAGIKAQVVIGTTGTIYVAALTPNLTGASVAMWANGGTWGYAFTYLTDIAT